MDFLVQDAAIIEKAMWFPFDHGATLGQTGSEQGSIVLDEEYDHGARITLERNTRIAPYAITCGMYGWFFHTRFCGSEQEAREGYAAMKLELARLVDTVPAEDAEKHELKPVTKGIKEFVEKFP